MTKEGINNRSIQAINWLLESNVGLTKTALADTFAIKPAKFSEILNGRMNVGTEIMAALCANYNISPDWLLTGRGEMLREEQYIQSPSPDTYERDSRDTEVIAAKDLIIKRDAELIDALQHRIRDLESRGVGHSAGLGSARSVDTTTDAGIQHPHK